MRIVTNLLHANYKENLMNRFSANKKKKILKACLYLFMLPWQRHIRQLSHQKPKFVLLTNLWPFLTTERSRVLEKRWMKHRYQKLCSATLSYDGQRKRVFTPDAGLKLLEHLFASNKFNKDNSKQNTKGHFEFVYLCWYEKPSYLSSKILKQIINWWSTLSIISVTNKKPSSVGSYKNNTRCKQS